MTHTLTQARPPKRIQVGYITYEIIDDHRRLDEASAEALHVGNDGKIFVDLKGHPDIVRQHLVHEVFHACLHAAQCDTDKTPAGEDGEEFIVLAASPVWLETLRRNPALVTYLTARG